MSDYKEAFSKAREILEKLSEQGMQLGALDESILKPEYEIEEIGAPFGEILEGYKCPEKEIAFQYLIIKGFAYSFDTECIYDPKEDYKQMVENLKKLSKNELDGLEAEVVYEEGSEDNPVVSLTLDSDQVSGSLKLNKDWVDIAGLIQLINSLLIKKGMDKLFFEVDYTQDQRATVFYGTAKLKEALVDLLV